ADLGALLDALRLVLGDHERRVPAGPERRVDRRNDDVNVGDAAIGRPRLLAVEDPVAGRLVALGRRADRRDVGARIGLRRAVGGDLGLGLAAVAAGDPLADLLA